MFSMGKMNHQYLPLFLASCFFFISLSQTSSNTSSHHHCLPDQSAHLLQLRQEFVEWNYSGYYDYYNGSYPKMKSWKADSDCCSWDGVTCDTENGEVIGLDLSNSWLYGPLNSNSSLFSLRHLRKLNLALNNFTFSTIPSEFGQLVRLTHLNLSRSFLHGRIPSEISWLSNLVSLDLSSNFFYYYVGGDYYEKLLDLRRIDLEALVKNMTYLRELHLDDVSISSSLPQSLANLSSLTSLSLSWCYLQGKFPLDIFLLPKIQDIDLSDNIDLVGFVPKFQSSSSLKELHLSFTKFSGELPNSISNLKSLNYLDLGSSNFSGTIPPSIGNLSQLTHLFLSYNNFHGQLPSILGNLKSLNYLDLGSSNFSGAIPPSIGNLSQLTYLSLSYNNFHGQLPSTMGKLAKLTSLGLVNILYYREVPFFLGNLTQLEDLSLSQNNFDCGFPIWLTNITTLQLEELDLSGNKVLVSKANINSTLPKFSYLRLSSCNLSKFPAFLEAQNELQHLDLSNNNIEGNIPKWFWNVGEDSLQYLNLSYNLLSKFEQPPVVFPWKNMYLLDLSFNMLQGSFPIPPLSTQYFLASKNKLTGSFPPMICKMHALKVLDVSNNQLTGQIPKCLLNLSNSLEVLAMKNNNFQGNLPETFKNGCSLVTLDLNHNQIHGKIPRSLVKCRMLESLSELKILVLQANGFYGPIWDPHINFGLSKLHVIDLSYNNFSGKLPSNYFQNWSAIQGVTDKDKSQTRYMGDSSNYYKDSMTIVNKGVELELVKILTIFTAIDLSNNQFYGEIPDSMGNLKALIVLNLSSNNFTSHIPSSLGNLIELESLDLSRNSLFGGQFLTFQSSSFEGNFGLCGFQLSKKCGNNEIPTSEMRHESSLGEGFGWKVVVIGYACGLVIGLVTGHVVTSRRMDWLVRNFGVNLRR
ncbi:hypothetical protein RGQ29_015940 [Quercus rubra]|uniref:Leucine-rich repeat-containing N-terminal plant-type domain-containing protein n=1 Tax=Quercus rubra TaxID=3512 RepID=A0AAN7FRB4_QUERU|nr:hypothetical protein RGQ29_015940 [Quercus rubra]